MSHIVYKSIGETPYELVKKFKEKNNYVKKVSFAGRLDPMAYGSMLLLTNDECKKQDLYLGCDKLYEFRILFGFKTDTYDILGKVLDSNNNSIDLENYDLSQYVKSFNQDYPPYSSIVVNKKPLWEWSKLNLLDSITIPNKKVTIYSLEEIDDTQEPSIEYNSLERLQNTIHYMINRLTDKDKFRGTEILNIWDSYFKSKSKLAIPIVKKYKAKVSSGTYIRSLVNQIGEDLGCGALALTIERTQLFT